MVQVERLLSELAGLLALRLTGATVAALCFCKQLMQPIKDRFYPRYEYWGRADPTRG